MLARDAAVFGAAVDDAHVNPEHPPWNGGWVHVDAAERTPEALLAAIRAGRFVSSCGPTIDFLEARGREVTVTCSPVQFARLVGPAHRGERVAAAVDGPALTRASFVVPEDWAHARIEIEDDRGRRAWTNALFV
jgi:hypothetical protein